MRLDEGHAVPDDPEMPMLRQQKPVVYARNGPAVLAIRPDRFDPARGFFAGDCRGYLMDARSSIDIDDPFDFQVAECLLAGADGPR
jgi:CMP-N-acetylneuraminic acid synthetase